MEGQMIGHMYLAYGRSPRARRSRSGPDLQTSLAKVRPTLRSKALTQ